MNRLSFGTWGLGLDEKAFARALAALGVLHARQSRRRSAAGPGDLDDAILGAVGEGEEPILWRMSVPPSRLARQPTFPDAPDLADAWEAFRAVRQQSIRLAVRWDFPLEAHLSWIVEQLSRAEVGAQSVFLLQVLPMGEIEWHWPLRIGLLGDPASQALRAGLEGSHWAGRLFRFVDMQVEAGRCDLLLLPHSLRDAVARTLDTPIPPHASGVVVLRGFEEPWARAEPLIAALNAGTQAGGVALARIPAAQRASWFDDLVTGLSHNDPLDTALYQASRQQAPEPPLILASRDLLDTARTQRTAEDLRRRVLRMQPLGAPVEVSSRSARFLKLPPGPHPPEEVAARLEQEMPRFAWSHESDEATAVAELAVSVEPMEEAAQRPLQQPRWLQEKVWDFTVPRSPRRLRRAFRNATLHAIDVRVGTEDREWTSAPSAFPVEKLPPTAEAYELTVVFTESRLAREPQVGRIRLPRDGSSSTCRFYLQTDTTVQQVEARIVVLHGNRVLQTALLQGTVMQDPKSAPRRQRIRLSIETVVRASFAELGARTPFDAALVLNHDGEGVPGVLKISGDLAEYIRLDHVEKSVRNISKRLSEVAESPEDYRSLDSKATERLLRFLAIQGTDLYRAIVVDRGASRTYADATRIQVVAPTPEAFLPLEFLYDREPPDPNVKVCRNGRQALAAGHCLDTCPKGEELRTVVCPLGFWCTSRIIERQTHDPASAGNLQKMDFSSKAETTGRTPLNMLGHVVYAVSDRVDNVQPGLSLEVLKALRDLAASVNDPPAKSWREWVDEVKRRMPALLVLLPHTFEDREDLKPALEIGSQEALISTRIRREHVRAQEKQPPPVVLLLGCQTGNPELPFEGFVAQFFRQGASIVLSTIATVVARHAAPIAQRLVRAMARHPDKPDATFGEIMLELKREGLAAGLPVVLCLVAYGDATWILHHADRGEA